MPTIPGAKCLRFTGTCAATQLLVLDFGSSDLVWRTDIVRRLTESTQFEMQVDAFLECSVGSLMHVLPPQLQRALQLTLVNSLQQHHSSHMLLDTSAALSALSVPHSAPYLMQVTVH